MTLVTGHLDLDAETSAQNANLSGLTAGDRAQVVAVLKGFRATDTVQQIAFTAKINLADSDTDPNTIQSILPSPDGFWDSIDDETLRVVVYLEPSETTKLLTARYYDFKVWLLRDGVQYERVVQRGRIVAVPTVTDLTKNPDVTSAVVLVLAPFAVGLTSPNFASGGPTLPGGIITSTALDYSSAAAVLGGPAVGAIGAQYSALGETLGGFAAAMTDINYGSDANVLGGDAVTVTSDNGAYMIWRPGDAASSYFTFSAARAGAALYLDVNGIWQSASTNVLRDAHYLGGVRHVLNEDSVTNIALGSCSYADATYWGGNLLFTIATATSCIAGQTAYKHTQLLAALSGRTQNVGTFTNNQVDVFWVIIENVDAATSRLAIYDTTAAATLMSADLTWSNHTVAVITGSGETGIFSIGNGRYIFWINATGTASGTGATGNTRTAIIYPSGAGSNALSTTLHHAQFAANVGAHACPSSPIVTVGATVTRATDLTSVLLNPAVSLRDFSLYIEGTEIGCFSIRGGSLNGFALGSTSVGANPTLRLREDQGTNPTQVQAIAQDSAGNANTVHVGATGPTYGQTFTALLDYRNSDGKVRASGSVNGGAVTVSAFAGSAVVTANMSAVGAYAILMGTGSTWKRCALSRIIIARGNPWPTTAQFQAVP